MHQLYIMDADKSFTLLCSCIPLKGWFYGYVCAIYCPNYILKTCDGVKIPHYCCLFNCHIWKSIAAWALWMHVRCVIIQFIVAQEMSELSPISQWNVPMAKLITWVCTGMVAVVVLACPKVGRIVGRDLLIYTGPMTLFYISPVCTLL